MEAHPSPISFLALPFDFMVPLHFPSPIKSRHHHHQFTKKTFLKWPLNYLHWHYFIHSFKGKIILMDGLWIFELIGRLFLYESITRVADRTQPLLTHFILIPPGTTQPNTIKQSA